MTSIHVTAVVGSDGEITVNIPDLKEGQTVAVTIEVPEATTENDQAQHREQMSAIELLKLPRDERDRLLAVAAEDAAEEYRTNPDLLIA